MADNARTRFLKLLSCIQHGNVDINAPSVLITDLDKMMYACAIDDDTYNDEQVCYIVADAVPYSAGWLSLESDGEALTPQRGVLYIVASDGDYKDKIYRWTGSTYLLLGGGKQTFIVYINADEHTTIAIENRLSQAVTDEDTVEFGDTLTITATADANYTLKTLKVNGSNFTSGESLIVSGHINIEAESALNTYDLTVTAEGCTVEVKNGETVIEPGEDAVTHGQELTITVTEDPEKTITTLTVNSEVFVSGATHTVTGNVVIIAEAE
jgi:hypothetical protein